MNRTTTFIITEEPVQPLWYMYFSPGMIVVFCTMALLICCRLYTRRGPRRRGRDRDSDAEEPFLAGKEGLLVKRCDQTSTRNVEDRIINRLRRESQVTSWSRDEDDGRRPVIVFCVISSRIGTDIENAMRGVQGNSRVILVLLHCVLSSLLRGDMSDDEELLDPTMRDRMAGIAHFAFSDREGLYDCYQNTVGFQQLVRFVRSLE